MMDYSIKLNCGHTIVLNSCYKVSIYDTLLEGEVSLADSHRMFNQAIKISDKLWPGYPVVNIHKEGSYPLIDGLLAPVVTLAQFWSFSPVKDKSKHASSAILVWLEDKPDVFASSGNYDLIKTVDWVNLAFDYNW